jgi:hypothetical protein
VDFEAHAAGISHQRGSWLACRRDYSPKLKLLSCQKRVGEKDTLYHAQLDFYHLPQLRACASKNQHVEMLKEIPEQFGGALSAQSHSENRQQLRRGSSN